MKEFTSSVRPKTGSYPVGYRILAKTKATISPLIRLTIPPTTELTVDDRSAMLFLLDLFHKKNGDYSPRFMVCVVFVFTNIFIELAKFKHNSVYFNIRIKKNIMDNLGFINIAEKIIVYNLLPVLPSAHYK